MDNHESASGWSGSHALSMCCSAIQCMYQLSNIIVGVLQSNYSVPKAKYVPQQVFIQLRTSTWTYSQIKLPKSKLFCIPFAKICSAITSRILYSYWWPFVAERWTSSIVMSLQISPSCLQIMSAGGHFIINCRDYVKSSGNSIQCGEKR